MDWIKCSDKLPEDDERFKNRKTINVLVTTSYKRVRKVHRIYNDIQVYGIGVKKLIRQLPGCICRNLIKGVIMSSWTYINGTITAEPLGRTQAEKRYILETVLNHLPRVTVSEGDMDVYIIQKNGYNSSLSHDEFGERTNNLLDRYGNKSFDRGWRFYKHS